MMVSATLLLDKTGAVSLADCDMIFTGAEAVDVVSAKQIVAAKNTAINKNLKRISEPKQSTKYR